MSNNINVTPISLYTKGHLHAVGYPTHNSKNVKIFWGNVEIASAPDLNMATANAYLGIRLMSPKYAEWLTPDLREDVLKELLAMSYLVDDGLYRTKEGIAKNLKLGIGWYLITEPDVKNGEVGALRNKNMLVTHTLSKIDPDTRKVMNHENDHLCVTYTFDFTISGALQSISSSVRNVKIDGNLKEHQLSCLCHIASGIITKKRNMIIGDSRLTEDAINTIMSFYHIDTESVTYEELIAWFNNLFYAESKALASHLAYVGDSNKPRSTFVIEGATPEYVDQIRNEFLNQSKEHLPNTPCPQVKYDGIKDSCIPENWDSRAEDIHSFLMSSHGVTFKLSTNGDLEINAPFKPKSEVSSSDGLLPTPNGLTKTSRVTVSEMQEAKQIEEGINVIDTNRLYKGE